MTDETERIAVALRTIAWVALLVVIGGALGNCEARAEDLQPREGQGERDGRAEGRHGSGHREHARAKPRVRKACPGRAGSTEGYPPPAMAGSHARARLWLGRALVAEAGWTASQTEYVALAWVLAKRWQHVRGAETIPAENLSSHGGLRDSGRPDGLKIFPSFVDVIRTYCSGLGRQAHTPRQQWVRELPADGESKPGHWPDNASWKRHAPRWRRVLRLVDEWVAGEHPDPCPRAIHFGGDMDQPRGRMRAVCARLPAANSFFEVM